MDPLIAGILMAEGKLRDELLVALRPLPVRVFFEQPGPVDWTDFLERLSRLRTDVLFVDPSRLSEPFEEIVARIRFVSPPPAIMAVRDSADAETILQTVRAGADDFLMPPLGAVVKQALARVSQMQHKPAPIDHAAGKLAGFISVKGGCGATTIACHVAVELQRAIQRDILLADMDWHSGLIGFLMKAQSPYSLLDAVASSLRLDASYWNALVAGYNDQLDVIPAPSGPATPEQADPQRFLKVMRFVRTRYEWVIADLGSQVHPLFSALLGDFDELFLVSTAECAALYQAKRMIQFLLNSGCRHERLRLILNRIRGRSPLGAELREILSLSPYAELPEFADLEYAYAGGKLADAGSRLGRQFTEIARRMAGLAVRKEEKSGAPVFGWKAILSS